MLKPDRFSCSQKIQLKRDPPVYPIKLKCKLEYKSHYMYDMICRDCVISAITWLKEQLCTKQIESTNVESISTESDDEDTELVEEQAAVNRRQELTGDPLPSVVQFENLENQIYQCAPGENNIPKYIY